MTTPSGSSPSNVPDWLCAMPSAVPAPLISQLKELTTVKEQLRQEQERSARKERELQTKDEELRRERGLRRQSLDESGPITSRKRRRPEHVEDEETSPGHWQTQSNTAAANDSAAERSTQASYKPTPGQDGRHRPSK